MIGIAGMPYKCPPAPLEVAFLIEAELRERGLRDRSRVHFCSPIGRAFTIETVSEMATPVLEQKGIGLHTFFNVESIDADRQMLQSLEGEELPYDLLILVPPHRGAQVLIDAGLAPAPGGWLPTDRETLQVGGRTNVFALGDATDLPLSKAGSTAHFEAPVVAERVAAWCRAATPIRPRATTRARDVLLRDRRRQGHAAPVRLRPSAAAAQAQPLLAPGQGRLQQDLLAHGAARSGLGDDGHSCDHRVAGRKAIRDERRFPDPGHATTRASDRRRPTSSSPH